MPALHAKTMRWHLHDCDEPGGRDPSPGMPARYSSLAGCQQAQNVTGRSGVCDSKLLGPDRPDRDALPIVTVSPTRAIRRIKLNRRRVKSTRYSCVWSGHSGSTLWRAL